MTFRSSFPLNAPKGKLVVVTKESDITGKFKPGDIFKYVVTQSGKLVILEDNIEHVFGPAMAGGQVGDPVRAAGHARYYPGKGILFDLNTGHYKINDYRDRIASAKAQALKAFESTSHDVKGNASIAATDVIKARGENDVKQFDSKNPVRIPPK